MNRALRARELVFQPKHCENAAPLNLYPLNCSFKETLGIGGIVLSRSCNDRRYRKSARNPACSKCRSVVNASVIPASSMTRNEIQSVNDQSLSWRRSMRCSPSSSSCELSRVILTRVLLRRVATNRRKSERSLARESEFPNSRIMNSVVTTRWFCLVSAIARECAGSSARNAAR